MSEYKRKNDPAPIIDIGIWMDLLEFLSSLGILVCIYMIVFTSKQLTKDMPFQDSTMYLVTFLALHLIFLLRFVLKEMISDEPSWIAQQRKTEKNRVAQNKRDNQDKKLMQRIMEHDDLDLLFDLLRMTHPQVEKSAQLIPKFKQGCEAWLQANTMEGGFDVDTLVHSFETIAMQQVSDKLDDSIKHRKVFRTSQLRKLDQIVHHFE